MFLSTEISILLIRVIELAARPCVHAATLCVSANNNRFDKSRSAYREVEVPLLQVNISFRPDPLVDLELRVSSSDLIAECCRVEDKDIDD